VSTESLNNEKVTPSKLVLFFWLNHAFLANVIIFDYQVLFVYAFYCQYCIPLCLWIFVQTQIFTCIDITPFSFLSIIFIKLPDSFIFGLDLETKRYMTAINFNTIKPIVSHRPLF